MSVAQIPSRRLVSLKTENILCGLKLLDPLVFMSISTATSCWFQGVLGEICSIQHVLGHKFIHKSYSMV